MNENICGKCGGDHDEAGCTAIGAGTGAPPDDSDLAAIGSGASRSHKKTVIGSLITVLAIAAFSGFLALRGEGGKVGKAVATAKPPTGDTIALGCSIPSVDAKEVEARCDWARDGGVTFAGLRWDGDTLKGTLVVTLTDGRVYRSAEEMVVKAQKAKTPVTFLAQK